LIRIIKYLIGIIIFLIIFLPAKIYTQTLFIFLIIALISVIIIIAGIIKATYKNLSGAKFSLVGTIFLVSTGVNDLLLEYHIINTISLATLGFFVFVFLQSYMLSLKTSSKYEEERKITKHLSKLSELKDSFLTSNYFEIFKPLEILKNIVEAERIVLIVNENEEWFIKADINEKASSYELQNFDSVTEILNLGFDKDIAMQTIIKKEQSLIQNPKKETLFFPLKDNESVSALIILENNKKDFIFNSEILKLIESTEYQFVTFINTYKIYNQISEINTNLEDKVHTRMSEILEQNEILEKQRDEIEKRNSLLNSAYNRVKLSNLEINDGINYAKKIQNSLLPDKKDVKNLFPKSLIMYKPKDVLSGDFYWTDNILINGKENLFFAVADCTGHGVPGSLMSIVGNNLLSDTIIAEKIYDTAEILNSTHSKIIKRLNKEVNGTKFNDTIDIAIIKYIPAENTLQFSGARHPLLLIRNNELIEYKADKKSIGEIRRNQNTEKSTFSSIIIDIKKEDKIFLFSDGYEDQIGGKHVRKFLKKNLLDLILEINSIPFEKQHKILSETLTKWQGNNIQTDDILIAEIEF
jgi:serine phosphatase RsbU (regulator of sigma subunit)